MQVRISHVTRYLYDERLNYSVQALRLTPPSFAGQRVLSWTIEAPGIAKAIQFKDAFSNRVHLISNIALHGELTCKAEGVVETEDQAGIVKGLCETAPIRVFLRETPQTEPNDAIRALAASASKASTIDGMHALMNAVRDAVDYRIGASTGDTTAAEALTAGEGVCQDHAHVFISAARSAGDSRSLRQWLLPLRVGRAGRSAPRLGRSLGRGPRLGRLRSGQPRLPERSLCPPCNRPRRPLRRAHSRQPSRRNQ